METKLRIAFIKDWGDDLESLGGNCDGILAAISELSKRHEVTFITRPFGNMATDTKSFPQFGINYLVTAHEPNVSNFDVAVYWGSLDRPWHECKIQSSVPRLLCFAGGPTQHEFLRNFRHIFVESQIYEDLFRAQGVSVSRAFGTNTAIFRQERRTPKVFDSLYPASFCFHKDQEVFARALGSRGLAVGAHNELDIVAKCLQLHTPVLRRVSSASLADLYNMSHTTCVPCGPHGGSQRVVLESFACGTPVILSRDNDRCAEFVLESGFGQLVDPIPEAIRDAVNQLVAHPLDPQVGIDYIRNKWTEHHYADKLEQGILQCLNKPQ